MIDTKSVFAHPKTSAGGAGSILGGFALLANAYATKTLGLDTILTAWAMVTAGWSLLHASDAVNASK